SELAPNASALLNKLLPQYLDKDCIKVVEGGVPEATALLAQRFDHIFYTGGEAVARIVMEAAAKHLTPVTLELGGKSPCFVAADADLKVAADRICWGKFTNAGQTCIAPDYILVEPQAEKALLAELRATITDFYGDNPEQSKDFGRIINDRHHKRLCGLLEGQEAFVGGQTDEATRYIAPTVLHNVSVDSEVMAAEIFGPILPVLVVDSAQEAIRFINERARPLALYIFSESAGTQEKILRNTVSGGVCVNDTVSHFAVHGLPFGGVGNSGIGAYHGKHGFDAFSHAKSVVNRSTTVDVSLRYAPYNDLQLKIIRKVL
ncbi:MAG: aldehyde dehydrogenase family protein, partial [Myxococcota bacterium]|nr:aldehyde dehydrogenase family protein [Myxococcota bacterium]